MSYLRKRGKKWYYTIELDTGGKRQRIDRDAKIPYGELANHADFTVCEKERCSPLLRRSFFVSFFANSKREQLRDEEHDAAEDNKDGERRQRDKNEEHGKRDGRADADEFELPMLAEEAAQERVTQFLCVAVAEHNVDIVAVRRTRVLRLFVRMAVRRLVDRDAAVVFALRVRHDAHARLFRLRSAFARPLVSFHE